jgi:hypothetical protein
VLNKRHRHRWNLCAIILLLLPACKVPSDPAPPIGLLQTSPGRLEVLYGLCPGEVLRRVEVLRAGDRSDNDSDRLYWKLVATDEARVDSFVVGVSPKGFAEEVSVNGPMPDEFEILTESNKVTVAVSGKITDLEADRVRYAGKSVTRLEFVEETKDGCG